MYENHANYEEERANLIYRIQAEGISGAIILSGDRHHSEVMMLTSDKAPAIWEFTTSPLTASPNSNVDEVNENRIAGSPIQERNFSILHVSGPRRERSLNITFYNSEGKEIFGYLISEEALK